MACKMLNEVAQNGLFNTLPSSDSVTDCLHNYERCSLSVIYATMYRLLYTNYGLGFLVLYRKI